MSNWQEDIPTISITQDLIDFNSWCSVCREDFEIGEPVKKLHCNHVFHTMCIMPWLDRCSTCPVCRRNVGSEAESDDENDDDLWYDYLPDDEDRYDLGFFASDEEDSEMVLNGYLTDEGSLYEDGLSIEVGSPNDGCMVYVGVQGRPTRVSSITSIWATTSDNSINSNVSEISVCLSMDLN